MGDLADAVRKATAKILARDQAVRALAITYAESIDRRGCSECGHPGAELNRLGPALLAALEALQLSPRARKAVTPVAGTVKTNPIDEIANFRARKRRPPAVDTPAP